LEFGVYLLFGAWKLKMGNHKSQIPKIKQILITQIQNSKRDIVDNLLFWSFEFRVWKLFDI